MSECIRSLEINRSPRAVILRTHGYIDENAGRAVVDAVQRYLDQNETVFLFNLAESPVINSTGIACFFELSEEITVHRQGTVAFCCLSKAIGDVFRIIGISDIHCMFEDETQALTALADN